jgi:hypothetical protein
MFSFCVKFDALTNLSWLCGLVKLLFTKKLSLMCQEGGEWEGVEGVKHKQVITLIITKFDSSIKSFNY